MPPSWRTSAGASPRSTPMRCACARSSASWSSDVMDDLTPRLLLPRPEPSPTPADSSADEVLMRLRYGVNQADQCWDFAAGPYRQAIGDRLRAVDTRTVRLFLFD